MYTKIISILEKNIWYKMLNQIVAQTLLQLKKLLPHITSSKSKLFISNIVYDYIILEIR